MTSGRVTLDGVIVAAAFAAVLVRVVGLGLLLYCESLELHTRGVRARRSAVFLSSAWTNN